MELGDAVHCVVVVLHNKELVRSVRVHHYDGGIVAICIQLTKVPAGRVVTYTSGERVRTVLHGSIYTYVDVHFPVETVRDLIAVTQVDRATIHTVLLPSQMRAEEVAFWP